MLEHEDIAEIIENKGLETAILDYIVPDDVSDKKLRKAFVDAKKAIENILKILDME